jgi:hypothetical protein
MSVSQREAAAFKKFQQQYRGNAGKGTLRGQQQQGARAQGKQQGAQQQARTTGLPNEPVTLNQFQQRQPVPAGAVDVYAPKAAKAPASGGPEGGSGFGTVMLLFVLAIVAVGGIAFLFMMMRGKFKSIEEDISAINPQDDSGRLQASVDALKKDVSTLAQVDADPVATYQDYDWLRARFSSESADPVAIEAELTRLTLPELRVLLERSSAGKDGAGAGAGTGDALESLVQRVYDAKAFAIVKTADGLSLTPDVDKQDSTWVFNDGLVRKRGDLATKLTFTDEWIRVCNGANCSEVALAPAPPPDGDQAAATGVEDIASLEARLAATTVHGAGAV